MEKSDSNTELNCKQYWNDIEWKKSTRIKRPFKVCLAVVYTTKIKRRKRNSDLINKSCLRKSNKTLIKFYTPCFNWIWAQGLNYSYILMVLFSWKQITFFVKVCFHQMKWSLLWSSWCVVMSSLSLSIAVFWWNHYQGMIFIR